MRKRSCGRRSRGNMTCETCREQMCTDSLLTKLRCAECRQIKFEQISKAVFHASLVVLGGIFGWLLTRGSE